MNITTGRLTIYRESASERSDGQRARSLDVPRAVRDLLNPRLYAIMWFLQPPPDAEPARVNHLPDSPRDVHPAEQAGPPFRSSCDTCLPAVACVSWLPLGHESRRQLPTRSLAVAKTLGVAGSAPLIEESGSHEPSRHRAHHIAAPTGRFLSVVPLSPIWRISRSGLFFRPNGDEKRRTVEPRKTRTTRKKCQTSLVTSCR